MIIVILVMNAVQHAASKINARIPNSATKHAPRIQIARRHSGAMIKDVVARGIVALFKYARVSKNSETTVISTRNANLISAANKIDAFKNRKQIIADTIKKMVII